MIRLGLIGAGVMGSVHAAAYEKLAEENKDFIISAVADTDYEKARKLADKFGAGIFSSGKELIENGNVSAVDICLPTFLHTEHAVMAMEKGFHVFIEKPVCLNENEAVMLENTRLKTNVKAAVGHCIRFWPEYMYLKKLVDQNIYGKIISAEFKRISPRPAWSWQHWLIDGKKSGSAALDLHIHDVDFVRYLMGMPDSIKCEISSVNGNNEHIFQTYRYGQTAVLIEGGWDYPGSMPFMMGYRVSFEGAAVIFDSGKTPSLSIYTAAGEALHPSLESEFTNKNLGGNLSDLAGYYNELGYFLNCLRQDIPIENISLEEGVDTFRLATRGIDTAFVQKI